MSSSHDLSSRLNQILPLFNQRECEAFVEIYREIYKELYHFTEFLYRNTTIDPKDVIQDLFLEVWQRELLKFESIDTLKGYLYVTIRNKFNMYYRHLKVVDRAKIRWMTDEEFVIEAAEAEIFGIIPLMLEQLPQECAKTLHLFLEGFDVNEISEKLQKRPSTIYRQRSTAIEILRRKFAKSDK